MISAKDWAAEQVARVQSTWFHHPKGLPPTSLYSPLPELSWMRNLVQKGLSPKTRMYDLVNTTVDPTDC